MNDLMKALSITLMVAGGTVASGATMAAGSMSSTPAAGEEEFEAGKDAVDARQYEKAVVLLTKAATLDPKNADAENLLGYSYRKLGKYDDALKHYYVALGLDPDHKGALEYLGEAYLELKNLPKAEEQLASLKRVCTSGCDELASLQKAVDAYKKANPTG